MTSIILQIFSAPKSIEHIDVRPDVQPKMIALPFYLYSWPALVLTLPLSLADNKWAYKHHVRFCDDKKIQFWHGKQPEPDDHLFLISFYS